MAEQDFEAFKGVLTAFGPRERPQGELFRINPVLAVNNMSSADIVSTETCKTIERLLTGGSGLLSR